MIPLTCLLTKSFMEKNLSSDDSIKDTQKGPETQEGREEAIRGTPK